MFADTKYSYFPLRFYLFAFERKLSLGMKTFQDKRVIAFYVQLRL